MHAAPTTQNDRATIVFWYARAEQQVFSPVKRFQLPTAHSDLAAWT
jgi:hypothetical protein